jgi:hypothetical protein
MPGAEHDEVVQALCLDALDQPLDVRVQVGRAVGQWHGRDPRSAERFIKPRGVLRVAVPDHLPRPLALGRCVDKAADSVREPRRVRPGGRPRDMRDSGTGVHEHQREGVAQPPGREHARGQEVAGAGGITIVINCATEVPGSAGSSVLPTPPGMM